MVQASHRVRPACRWHSGEERGRDVSSSPGLPISGFVWVLGVVLWLPAVMASVGVPCPLTLDGCVWTMWLLAERLGGSSQSHTGAQEPPDLPRKLWELERLVRLPPFISNPGADWWRRFRFDCPWESVAIYGQSQRLVLLAEHFPPGRGYVITPSLWPSCRPLTAEPSPAALLPPKAKLWDSTSSPTYHPIAPCLFREKTLKRDTHCPWHLYFHSCWTPLWKLPSARTLAQAGGHAGSHRIQAHGPFLVQETLPSFGIHSTSWFAGQDILIFPDHWQPRALGFRLQAFLLSYLHPLGDLILSPGFKHP